MPCEITIIAPVGSSVARPELDGTLTKDGKIIFRIEHKNDIYVVVSDDHDRIKATALVRSYKHQQEPIREAAVA